MKNTITLTIAAIAVATSINVSTTDAEARVKGPRVTSIAVGCGMIQDELDQLVRDLRKAKSRAEANRIRARGHSLALQWQQIGCSAAYGNWWIKAMKLRLKPIAPKSGDVVAQTPKKKVFKRPAHRSTMIFKK